MAVTLRIEDEVIDHLDAGKSEFQLKFLLPILAGRQMKLISGLHGKNLRLKEQMNPTHAGFSGHSRRGSILSFESIQSFQTIHRGNKH